MFELQLLEDRRLLAWGTYPQLIRQDDAVATYPTINGSGVNIAVIDSGVDFNHTYLQGKFWTNPGEIAGNGIDDDNSGYIDDTKGWDFYGNDNNPEDQNGHGTAISGIIAANQFTHNGATYGGIAPGAKLIPLKIADPSGAYSTAFAQRVEKALQWVETNYARYNIRIVNMSLLTPANDYLSIYADEVSRLASKGVLIIAAGGQEDPDTDVVYPAADANAYGISVVNSNNTFPNDTVNRGPGIDLLAPGNGVPILLRGGGIGTSALATSYSTPFATGAAALVKQIAPSATSAQIMQVLKDSGVNVTDPSTGWTYSGRTYKRIELFSAIELAKSRFAPDTTKPTATASLADVITSGGTTYTFSVTYSDNVAVERNSLGSTDVRVTGPNSFNELATLISTSPITDGSPIVATYRINAPGGTWNGADNGTYTVSLVGSQVSDTSNNFANATTLDTFKSNIGTVGGGSGSITGVVFFDSNGNGLKNKFERTAIAGQVFLDLNGNGRIDSGEPNQYAHKRSGAFTFSNLGAGSYALRQIPPKNYRQTLPKKFYTITVGNAQAVNGIAFGDTNLAYVAGFVFNDVNGNGAQNQGEAGMSGWVVWLDDGDGMLEKSEQSLTTDSVGSYVFGAVPSGSYSVRVLAKSGWGATTATRYPVTVSAGSGVSGKLFGQRAV